MSNKLKRVDHPAPHAAAPLPLAASLAATSHHCPSRTPAPPTLQDSVPLAPCGPPASRHPRQEMCACSGHRPSRAAAAHTWVPRARGLRPLRNTTSRCGNSRHRRHNTAARSSSYTNRRADVSIQCATRRRSRGSSANGMRGPLSGHPWRMPLVTEGTSASGDRPLRRRDGLRRYRRRVRVGAQRDELALALHQHAAPCLRMGARQAPMRCREGPLQAIVSANPATPTVAASLLCT